MRGKKVRAMIALAVASSIIASMSGCGKSKVELNDGTFKEVDVSTLQFPLKEKTVITGMTSYPANTESDPNNRTIFKRLQEDTNVEIKWTAIQADQWGDKISLAMSNPEELSDFVFSAGFGDSINTVLPQELITTIESCRIFREHTFMGSYTNTEDYL